MTNVAKQIINIKVVFIILLHGLISHGHVEDNNYSEQQQEGGASCGIAFHLSFAFQNDINHSLDNFRLSNAKIDKEGASLYNSAFPLHHPLGKQDLLGTITPLSHGKPHLAFPKDILLSPNSSRAPPIS